MTAAGKKNNAGQLQGLLVVDKPGLAELSPPHALITDDRPLRLPTSHDIVNRVRRWSGEKRIGHTGTLDPLASGVLVLTIGNATRLTEYHQGHDKRYIAEITLGEATDTYDCTGTVVKKCAVPELSSTQIEAALESFRGSVMQVPPAFSAIKQDGKTAYQQARKGKEISLESRPVTFYMLELLEFRSPNVIRLDIHCSTGTYIRSLANDLSIALGSVGTLTYLRRTAVGPFTLAEAHTLPEIEAMGQAGELAQWLKPTNYGLLLPVVPLDEISLRRLGFGQQVKMPVDKFIALPDAHASTPSKGMLAQAVGPDGELKGIICCMTLSGEWNASSTDASQALSKIEQTREYAVWRADKWFIDSQLQSL